MTLVMDTSSLIAMLEKSGCPDLIQYLRMAYGKIAVPSSVKKEFEVKSDALEGHVKNGLIEILAITLPKDIATLMKNNPKLGKGESDTILSCQRLHERGVDAVCALDDKNARKLAKEAKLGVVGVLGLLDAVEDGGFLSPSKKWKIVKHMKDSGFYLPGSAPDPRCSR